MEEQRERRNKKFAKYEMESYNSVHQNDDVGKSVDV